MTGLTVVRANAFQRCALSRAAQHVVSVHMHRRIVCTIAMWPLLTAAGFAQSASLPAPVDMAHVEIGKPFPFPAIDPNADDTMAAQLGWYTFDAPNAPRML